MLRGVGFILVLMLCSVYSANVARADHDMMTPRGGDSYSGESLRQLANWRSCRENSLLNDMTWILIDV